MLRAVADMQSLAQVDYPTTPKSSHYSHYSHHSLASTGSRGSRGLLRSSKITLLDLIAQYKPSQSRHSSEGRGTTSYSGVGSPRSGILGPPGSGILGSPKAAAAALPVRPTRVGAASGRVVDIGDPVVVGSPTANSLQQLNPSAGGSPPRHPTAFPARPPAQPQSASRGSFSA